MRNKILCNIWHNSMVCVCVLQGEKILQELVELSGKISVRIAVNTFRDNQPQHDIQQLVNAGQFLSVHFTQPDVRAVMSSVEL